jgi:hypothetical protein
VDGGPVEILFIVVSPAFEALAWDERNLQLGLSGLEVSPMITAWPYTPSQFAGQFTGNSYDGLLAQFLAGSREVYVKTGATPLQKLLKAARRKS